MATLMAVTAACNDSPAASGATAAPTTADGVSSTGDTTVVPTGAARTQVRIDGLVIQAELARTAEERRQGLSGRDSLPDDSGMLFIFEEERLPAFWMGGMQFPLDFIWISSDRRVVDVTENVPHPAAAGETLSGIQPNGLVLYTLEVNAGVVREAGVQVGDAVTFEPDIPVEGTP